MEDISGRRMEGATDSRRNSTKGANTPAIVSANSSLSNVPPPSLSAASNIDAASPSDTTIPKCTNAPRNDFASMSGPPPISTNNSSTLTRISGVSLNSPYSSSTINTSESKRSSNVEAALPQVFALRARSLANGEGSFFCTGSIDVSMGGGRGGLPLLFLDLRLVIEDFFFFFFLPPLMSLSADVIAASRCCRAAAASSSMILAAARMRFRVQNSIFAWAFSSSSMTAMLSACGGSKHFKVLSKACSPQPRGHHVQTGRAGCDAGTVGMGRVPGPAQRHAEEGRAGPGAGRRRHFYR